MRHWGLELNWEPWILLIRTVHTTCTQQISSSVYDVPGSVLATVLIIILCLPYVLHLQVPCNLSRQWKISFPNLHIFFSNSWGHQPSCFQPRIEAEVTGIFGWGGPRNPRISSQLCYPVGLAPPACVLRLRKLVQTCFADRLPNLLSDQFHHSRVTKGSCRFFFTLLLLPASHGMYFRADATRDVGNIFISLFWLFFILSGSSLFDTNLYNLLGV